MKEEGVEYLGNSTTLREVDLSITPTIDLCNSIHITQKAKATTKL